MKNLLFTFVAVCFAALCLTGCLSDNASNLRYHFLTNAEKGKIISTMAGNYNGMMYWFKYKSDSLIYVKDSIKTEWTVTTDSMITVKLPVAFLSTYVGSDSAVIGARDTLASAPAEPVKFRVYAPNYVMEDIWSTWEDGNYNDMSFVPQETDHKFNIGTHEYTVTFSSSSNLYYLGYYYYPIVSYAETYMNGYILLKSITVDNNAYKLNMPIWLYGHK